MTSLPHNDVIWGSHAEMLNRIEDHVNNIGRIVAKVAKLQEER